MTHVTRLCTSVPSPVCSVTCSDCVAVTAGARRSTSDIASWLGRGHCRPAHCHGDLGGCYAPQGVGTAGKGDRNRLVKGAGDSEDNRRGRSQLSLTAGFHHRKPKGSQ